jgi:hypothetical protein
VTKTYGDANYSGGGGATVTHIDASMFWPTGVLDGSGTFGGGASGPMRITGSYYGSGMGHKYVGSTQRGQTYLAELPAASTGAGTLDLRLWVQDGTYTETTNSLYAKGDFYLVETNGTVIASNMTYTVTTNEVPEVMTLNYTNTGDYLILRADLYSRNTNTFVVGAGKLEW